MQAVLASLFLGASLLLRASGAALSGNALLTCDDFGGCPKGWSLVASPSIVACDGACTHEKCCEFDEDTEVVVMSEVERRLAVNETTNATSTVTTTATTTTTTTTPTTTATATTTATSLLDAYTKIAGEIVVDLNGGDVAAFINDQRVKDSMEESLAEKTGVPKSWVKFGFSANRRLTQGPLRRLADVKATYIITLPPNRPSSGLGSSVSADSVTTAIGAITPVALTTAVLESLAAKGVTSISITIATIESPVVSVGTTTTTTEVMLESLALTKAAFTPGHVVAILAVVMSALWF